MIKVVAGVDKIQPGLGPHERMAEKHEDQHREMKRVQSRKPPEGECGSAYFPAADGLGIQKEENKSREHEEKVDRDFALVIKHEEKRVKGKSLWIEFRFSKKEMLPVPEYDGKRGQPPDHVEGIKMFWNARPHIIRASSKSSRDCLQQWCWEEHRA